MKIDMTKTQSLLVLTLAMALSHSAFGNSISQPESVASAHNQLNSRSVLHSTFVGNGYIASGTEVGNGYRMKNVYERWGVGNG